ncbi:MAG: Nucleotidyltransferase [Candidatus Woesebacteria bacterium GW2011_GWB1_38_5b]|uniref:Nucleotidyltransferase n=1 Tax=Candidatus Woesebacteria bacterium GW2011_GWB1_38_5b TaxID=1618569 RepID=A0A0G0KIN0_9BACT|nr:MAG: Nucleotidyltransferase [Candidatus Woesebacteria bacterium GW2011_GWB1_38_5b]
MDSKLESIKQIFQDDQDVKLAYLFGSQARGDTGPLSDYDFAIYLSEKDKKKIFDKKIEIQDKISRILKTNHVDVTVLDGVEEPEFKYAIISQGKLLFEREPYKMLLEPKIMNEYFDFRDLLLKYNLTSL